MDISSPNTRYFPTYGKVQRDNRHQMQALWIEKIYKSIAIITVNKTAILYYLDSIYNNNIIIWAQDGYRSAA